MSKLRTIIGVLIFCLSLSACQSPQPQPTVTPVAYSVPSVSTVTPTAPLPRASPTPTAMIISPQPLTGSPSCAVRPGDPWRVWRAIQNPTAVNSLLIEQGELWASMAYGVFRINPNTGVFTRALSDGTIGYGSSLYPGSGGSLFPLGDGRVWISTTRGHYYFDGQEWTRVELSNTIGSPSPWAIDRNGNFMMQGFQSRSYLYFRFPGHVPPRDREWVATRVPYTETVRLDNCEMQMAASPGFYYRSRAECQSLMRARQTVQEKGGNNAAYTAVDADGSTWWLSRTYASYGSVTLGHIEENSTTTLLLPVGPIYSIVPDPVHGVWLGTGNGLVYSDGNSLRQVSLGLGVCAVPGNPHSLVVDMQGTAWVVTQGGVRAIAPEETEWLLVSDPTSGNPGSAAIHSITPAVGGGLWGTHSRDVFRLGGAVTSSPVELPDQRCYVERLVADANNVWGSRANCGVMQFNIASGSWSRHSPGGDNVELVALTTEGTVYATGRDGLYVYAGGAEWRNVFKTDVTMLAADRQNGIWFVSNLRSQLWYYKDDQVTAHSQPFQKRVLQSLTVDSHSRLWASLGDKLQVYDGKNWRDVAPPMRQIRELASGPDGRIWIVGDLGVAVYDPAMDRQP